VFAAFVNLANPLRNITVTSVIIRLTEDTQLLKIIGIAGARPNFMKIDPIFRQLDSCDDECNALLVHTGQHYDSNMSRIFFEELGIRRPDYDLGVGSGSHATQTAQVMMKLEPILVRENPDLVVVVGDVNSSLAAALTAAKLNIPIAHVEAGLRSYDRRMPEETNRIVTDALSTFLFTTSRDADANLLKEGIQSEKIHFVGNVMIDTLLRCRGIAEQSKIFERLDIEKKAYFLVTLHRPSNVDDNQVLEEIIGALMDIAVQHKVVFPLHPRTADRLKQNGHEKILQNTQNVILLPSLGYIDFLALEANARAVLTDSGGVQEETTVLGIPCLTIRENTERPVTVQYGTNLLVGHERKKIVAEAYKCAANLEKTGRIPELWDGKAALRVVETIKAKIGQVPLKGL